MWQAIDIYIDIDIIVASIYHPILSPMVLPCPHFLLFVNSDPYVICSTTTVVIIQCCLETNKHTSLCLYVRLLLTYMIVDRYINTTSSREIVFLVLVLDIPVVVNLATCWCLISIRAYLTTCTYTSHIHAVTARSVIRWAIVSLLAATALQRYSDQENNRHKSLETSIAIVV